MDGRGIIIELYPIAATVIGGASLLGGRGTISGTFLDGLVMATVIQVMDYANLENWLQLVVRGCRRDCGGSGYRTKDPPEWLRTIGHHQRLE